MKRIILLEAVLCYFNILFAKCPTTIKLKSGVILEGYARKMRGLLTVKFHENKKDPYQKILKDEIDYLIQTQKDGSERILYNVEVLWLKDMVKGEMKIRKDVWLDLEKKGTINLYSKISTFTSENKSTNTKYTTKTLYYYCQKEGMDYCITMYGKSEDFMKAAEFLFSDYPELLDKIASNEVGYWDLPAIVDEYNQYMGE